MIGRAALLAVALLVTAAPAADAAFPGGNGKIAFSSAADGDSEIYTINPDGTGLTQLTHNAIGDFSPSWSPDGQEIVFLRADAADFDIWKMDADGGGEVLVHDYPGAPGFYPKAPAWSPDGTKIIFGVNDPDSNGFCRADFGSDICGLFLVNPDGTGFQTFVETTTEACCPSWSPDGSRVLFSAEGFGAADAWSVVVKPINGAATTLAEGPGIFDRNLGPDWAPGQDKIVYMYQPENSNDVNVKAMNPDGSGKVQGHQGSSPVFSPDGTKVAFFSSGPPVGIWTGSAPLGAGAIFLTSGGSPSWQPIPVNGYPRPKGATPFRASFTTAYNQCTAPDRTHGPPLAFPSCASPQKSSAHLTVGTGDSNGLPARNEGYLRLETVVGAPGGLDDADVKLDLFMDDVYTNALASYGGEIRAHVMLRITDKDNTPHPGGPGAATTTEIPLDVIAPCVGVAAPQGGSVCSVSTTADALAAGTVKESRRSVWQLGRAEVYDGGPDGDANTPSGDTLFATQGLFIP